MLIRGGGPKSGYVSTGFFSGKLLNTTVIQLLFIYLILGLTLGRVILFPITDRVNTFISYSTTFQCESNGYNNTARGR